MERTLKRNSEPSLDSLISDFLESVTAVHKIHLKITGVGSYAAHKAMNSFYDEIGDLSDGLAEAYQGLMGKVLELKQVPQPVLKTKKDCIDHLSSLYNKINAAQALCSHSEIINDLDNAKTLINKTKYKLLFLQ